MTKQDASKPAKQKAEKKAAPKKTPAAGHDKPGAGPRSPAGTVPDSPGIVVPDEVKLIWYSDNRSSEPPNRPPYDGIEVICTVKLDNDRKYDSFSITFKDYTYAREGVASSLNDISGYGLWLDIPQPDDPDAKKLFTITGELVAENFSDGLYLRVRLEFGPGDVRRSEDAILFRLDPPGSPVLPEDEVKLTWRSGNWRPKPRSQPPFNGLEVVGVVHLDSEGHYLSASITFKDYTYAEQGVSSTLPDLPDHGEWVDIPQPAVPNPLETYTVTGRLIAETLSGGLYLRVRLEFGLPHLRHTEGGNLFRLSPPEPAP